MEIKMLLDRLVDFNREQLTHLDPEGHPEVKLIRDTIKYLKTIAGVEDKIELLLEMKQASDDFHESLEKLMEQ